MFRGTTVSYCKKMLADQVLIYGITHTKGVWMILSTRSFNVENQKVISSFTTQYKDKRRHTGYINRYCNRDWFKFFDFVCYSKAEDGLYCVGCVLFLDTSHRCSSKLITEPYKNWKDACEDLKTHAQCEYLCWAFRDTYDNPASRIDITIAEEKLQQCSVIVKY